MQLRLIREPSRLGATLGVLFVDGVFECFTLEDVVRAGEKVDGQTAIPAGRYQVVITFSNRFQRPLPLLVNVPGFERIRIHAGNTDADTEGCILVGADRGLNAVLQSRLAFADLFPKLETALKAGRCTITIENPEAAPTSAPGVPA